MNCLDLTLENVINICKGVCCDDSYAVSPTYYMMTGRNGGMIFEDNERFVIAIKHPNKSKSWLVFPCISSGKKCFDLSLEIKVAKILLKKEEIKEVVIARIPNNKKIEDPFSLVEEPLLDWKYPIQILDVEKVVEHKGKSFQQLRQRLNNINLNVSQMRPLNIYEDELIIRNIAKKWVDKFPYKVYSDDDLISPTTALVNLMKSPELNIYGHIVYYCGRASAYSIWEESGNVSNVYAMTADRNIPGLAELNIVIMCQTLFLKGIELVNLGGSESEGLNRYKKKFAPIHSIELKCCIIK